MNPRRMAKTHSKMSKTATRTNGEAGPSESKTGPPTMLYIKAATSMKKVSSIVIAPRTSLGKFFMKSDSSAMTYTIENTIMSETREYATTL